MITTAGAELTKENLIQAQKEDPILQEVRGWVEHDIHPEKQELAGKDEDLRTYAQLRDTLTIHQDILYTVQQLSHTVHKSVHRICVPSSLKESTYFWAHEHPSAGHFGS